MVEQPAAAAMAVRSMTLPTLQWIAGESAIRAFCVVVARTIDAPAAGPWAARTSVGLMSAPAWVLMMHSNSSLRCKRPWMGRLMRYSEDISFSKDIT